MQLRPFAKINLDLRVLGRRDDGYHEVRTILQTIDWFDEISIEPADQFRILRARRQRRRRQPCGSGGSRVREADRRDRTRPDRVDQARSDGRRPWGRERRRRGNPARSREISSTAASPRDLLKRCAVSARTSHSLRQVAGPWGWAVETKSPPWTTRRGMVARGSSRHFHLHEGSLFLVDGL